MTNIYGHRSIGNRETLNIFEQGNGIISYGLQEINLAASSGNIDLEKEKMRGRERSGRLLCLPRVSGRKEGE